MRRFYLTPRLWNKIFLTKTHFLFRYTLTHFTSNRITIPLFLANRNYSFYTGKRWKLLFIHPWMVGFRPTNFLWTKKMSLYKSKQIRKKRMKLAAQQAKIEQQKLNRAVKKR